MIAQLRDLASAFATSMKKCFYGVATFLSRREMANPYLGPVDLLRSRGIALSNCCQPSELTAVPCRWMASSLGNVAKTAID